MIFISILISLFKMGQKCPRFLYIPSAINLKNNLDVANHERRDFNCVSTQSGMRNCNQDDFKTFSLRPVFQMWVKAQEEAQYKVTR
ncbi:MAG: hypothetical protein RBG13Loki_3061 [Promethearchaeota archaeon CR_4]|nr:MAG: hypothetical protein RBG13Loki_3061 [Candidatus Lokiarchaeota archaeon CR_4]